MTLVILSYSICFQMHFVMFFVQSPRFTSVGNMHVRIICNFILSFVAFHSFSMSSNVNASRFVVFQKRRCDPTGRGFVPGMDGALGHVRQSPTTGGSRLQVCRRRGLRLPLRIDGRCLTCAACLDECVVLCLVRCEGRQTSMAKVVGFGANIRVCADLSMTSGH